MIAIVNIVHTKRKIKKMKNFREAVLEGIPKTLPKQKNRSININLIDQKEPIFQFHKETIKKENESNQEIIYSKKIIKPSKQELENHKDFIKREFKRNFFN